MKFYSLIILALLFLAIGCKKNNASQSLIGSSMTVTRVGTTLQLGEVNIFTPNGDARNEYFVGPIYSRVSPTDSVISYSLKINNVINSSANGLWNGSYNNSTQPEGVYSYEVDYITVNGSATAKGLVRLWRSSTLSCAEKPLYKFPDAYNTVTGDYNNFSTANENLPCR